MKESWHDKEINDVLLAFNVSQSGLTNEEAQIRLKKYGPNELIEAKKITPFPDIPQPIQRYFCTGITCGHSIVFNNRVV